MALTDLTLTELEQGWHQTETAFVCNYCEATFETTQVFPVADKFYPAAEMIRQHLATAHPNAVADLIHTPSKYNTLTAKQQALLVAFASGSKDAEIAREMGVAAATIRHQKFTFREKAKQAKLYLAMYDRVFTQPTTADALVTLPEQVAPEDDRFALTTTEYHQALAKYFSTMNPLRLQRWPKKQKAILAVLRAVAATIPSDQRFTESALTTHLKPIYADYPLLRRYLVDYGFLKRTTSGSAYWRNPDYKL